MRYVTHGLLFFLDNWGSACTSLSNSVGNVTGSVCSHEGMDVPLKGLFSVEAL